MRKLLVVEDDDDTAAMLALLLEAGGYSVDVAEDVVRARLALEQSAHDLVISDLRLQDLSLAECWAAIEQFVTLARPAPVGLLSGWNVTDDEARSHGAAFVVRKPSSRDALFVEIANALGLPPVDGASVARIHAYFAAIEEARFAALGELCIEDVVYRLPGSDSQFATEVQGRSRFVEFARTTFEGFAEPRFAVHAIRPLPSGALVEYTGSWRVGATCRELPGAIMFGFRDDRFSRIDIRLATEELR